MSRGASLTTALHKSTAAGDRLCLGVISGAHGLKGEVRVKSFTAEPADIAAYGPLSDDGGDRVWSVTVRGRVRGQLIVRLDGVDDRAAAETLKGVKLHVPRDVLPDLPADEYYHADLVGLSAALAAGGDLGVVRAVHDFGAGPVLEVAGRDGGEVLVPFTRDVVPEVDLGGGRLVVDPPPGLVEEAEGRRKSSAAGREDGG